MAWRQLTADDIRYTLSRVELETYTRVTAPGEQDAMIDALAKRTSALVRSYLSAAGYKLPPDETWIPESLVSPACDYAVYDILKSLPLKIQDARLEARKEALTVLEGVSTGKVKVEVYAGTDAQVSVSPLPQYNDADPARKLDEVL